MHPVAQPTLTQPNGPGTPPQPGPPQSPPSPPQSPPPQSPPPQSPPCPCPWPWPSCCHGNCGAFGKGGAAFATPDPSPRAANPSVLAIVTLAAIAFRFIMRPPLCNFSFRGICSEPFQRSEAASGYGIGYLRLETWPMPCPSPTVEMFRLVHRPPRTSISRFGHGHIRGAIKPADGARRGWRNSGGPQISGADRAAKNQTVSHSMQLATM
jgi:hypothetical protein